MTIPHPAMRTKIPERIGQITRVCRTSSTRKCRLSSRGVDWCCDPADIVLHLLPAVSETEKRSRKRPWKHRAPGLAEHISPQSPRAAERLKARHGDSSP